MMSTLDQVAAIVALIVGVIAVSALARAIRVPAPILLVVAGVGASLIPAVPDVRLNPELVLVVLLPPLLYATARSSSLIDIRRDARAIGLLAIGLVLATTAVVGFGLHAVADVPIWAAIALGAIVAPPDAVAATAVARRSGLGRRTLTVLEGESLFNDATALVSLRVAIAAVAGSVGLATAAGEFLLASVGGVAVGLAVGWVLVRVRRHVTDAITGTALSLVAPFIAFLPAELIEASGVIAVVVAGLLMAHHAPLDQRPRARLVETSTWGTIQFLLEGTVFALIGLELREVVGTAAETPLELAIAAAVVLGAVVLVRPAWVFGAAGLARLTPWRDRAPGDNRQLAALSWAGMRGVVSLAAALSLPADFPRRELLIVLTVIVIIGTLGIQGLSLPWVIRRLGIQPPDPRLDDLQKASAQDRATAAALARLDEVAAADDLPDAVVDRLRRLAEIRTEIAWERLGDVDAEAPSAAYRRVRREMITAERQVLVDLRDKGELDEEVLRQVQLELDLEETLLFADGGGEPAGGMLEELLADRAQAERACEHLRAAADPPRPAELVCPACVELGLTWVHLRQCLDCGQVGCCDSSPQRHADAHWRATGHPVMRSAEPGEGWRWCYVDRQVG
jgi:Na+/H+ antiporter